MCSTNFRVQLINSDYKVGFEIKRESLYNLMSSGSVSNVICSYEPCIYPGVKFQYFWNNGISDKAHDGICRCVSAKTCSCKKITIAVFQSGCIIITGSQIPEQIQACYEFINYILYTHKSTIQKKSMQALRDKKSILIKKSQITY